MELEQLTIDPAHLGEGPCWHAKEQVLYWIDILAQKLHRFDPDSGDDQQWDIGELLGTVAPRESGGLILALEDGLALFDPSTAKLERLPTIDAREETRFNDGKCDPRGRFWVGTMDKVQESRPLGSLYRIDPEGAVHVMQRDITISNGLAWSPDETTMYYIDSPTKTVVAFDNAPDTGEISNPRVVITLDDEQGFPDGMTIDNQGMLWIAHWGGQRVCRWDPGRGEVLETYRTPAPHTSCCCFGGPDLTDLYITTARKGLTPELYAEFPLSGHLFRLRTGVVGMPTYAYRG